MLFNIDFANKTISLSLLLFFLIIGLYFLIPRVFMEIVIQTVEIQTKDTTAEMETHQVIVKVTICKWSK